MKFFLSSGGTGGHIFPAEALAEELIQRGHEVIFITDERYKNYDGSEKKFRIEKIPTATLKGGVFSKLKALTKIFFGIMVALKILVRNRGGVVIGFGGYPSFPAIIAARILSLKIIIHEQNAVLGIANRALAPLADIIATSFLEVRDITVGNARKICYIGNPVRGAIAEVHDRPYPEIDKNLNILVIGGSLGATIFSDVVPAALAKLEPGIRKKIKISQQARAEDVERVKKNYAEIGIIAEVENFFTDVPKRLAAAHLVIARAGASTVVELAVAGRPSILVPYPDSKGDHQLYNARSLEKIGGAWVVEQQNFTPEALAFRLETIIMNPEPLLLAAENAKKAAGLKAAEKLAALAEKLGAEKLC